MKSPSLKAVTEITSLAPQFLVDDLSEAIDYYRDRLGFESDFMYESFYGVHSVIRRALRKNWVRSMKSLHRAASAFNKLPPCCW
jgi:hypothetical protein